MDPEPERDSSSKNELEYDPSTLEKDGVVVTSIAEVDTSEKHKVNNAGS